MTVTIYHNLKCGTSRGALEIIRERGIEPVRSGPPKADKMVRWTILSDKRRELERTAIEYLKTPLTRAELAALITRMACSWTMLREEAAIR